MCDSVITPPVMKVFFPPSMDSLRTGTGGLSPGNAGIPRAPVVPAGGPRGETGGEDFDFFSTRGCSTLGPRSRSASLEMRFSTGPSFLCIAIAPLARTPTLAPPPPLGEAPARTPGPAAKFAKVSMFDPPPVRRSGLKLWSPPPRAAGPRPPPPSIPPPVIPVSSSSTKSAPGPPPTAAGDIQLSLSPGQAKFPGPAGCSSCPPP
mmetsp:Transcript_20994/g.53022  ORF Transcript_20994/g.53022 Transcript_20994/m.53022 type:complete len:205 (+) Transcript_20994:437-1051(+)